MNPKQGRQQDEKTIKHFALGMVRRTSQSGQRDAPKLVRGRARTHWEFNAGTVRNVYRQSRSGM
jgi:hypothetical protein